MQVAYSHVHRMRGLMPGGPPAPPQRNSSLQASSYHSQDMPTNRSSESSSLRSTNQGSSFESRRSSGDSSTKPRLNRDQHNYLEEQFRLQNKPSTAVKKTIAESLGVSLEKINVSNFKL